MTYIMDESAKGTFILKEWEDPTDKKIYLVEFQKYIYNFRLFLTPKESPDGWDYAWCYRDLTVLVLAVPAWDMDVEDEPIGWHKRPTYNHIRQAPRRDPEAPMRCIHGCLPSEHCNVIGCPHA